MEPDELTALLDWDLAVKIGEEKRTNRIHRLFYSPDDQQCFVAIQDEKTQTIVTILPVDYYQTLAAVIPQMLMEEAQRLVSCHANVKSRESVSPAGDPAVAPSVPGSFKISGTFMNLDRKPRSVNLGSWPSQTYKASISRLLQDTRFFEVMQRKLREKMRPEEYVAGLAIRLGKKGEAVWVSVEDDGSELFRPLAKA